MNRIFPALSPGALRVPDEIPYVYQHWPVLGRRCATISIMALVAVAAAGCKAKSEGDGAPPPAKVVEVPDMNVVTIGQDDLSKFPLATSTKMEAPAQLNVTGSVVPDVSREVPVISLANGRVVEIKTRLDDNVKKGQLLFSVQSPDVTNAFNAYLKAVNDEGVTKRALVRAQDLLQHGAISEAMVEQADGAEKDAAANVTAAEEQLNLFGVDKEHPSPVVHVVAPISGVIITQNITNDAAAGINLSGSSTAFTIADLSSVWILCDVYENDLPKVRVGQEAKISVNAYPDKPLTGRVSDVGPVLDPNLRTAKVRIEVANPGFLKLGMFVSATLTSRDQQSFAVVPADAILHLHDREWVFVPTGANRFRRVEVRAGRMVDAGHQQILSGIQPGQQVVTNALLINTAGNQ